MSARRKMAVTVIVLTLASSAAQAGFMGDLLDWFGLGETAKPQVKSEAKPPPELFPKTALLTVPGGDVRIEENAGKVRLIVKRSVAFDSRVSLHWRAERPQTIPAGQSAAEPGRGFESASGELVFQPKETEKTIEIGIIDNKTPMEGDRVFDVVISGLSGAELDGPERVRVVIVEDDLARPGKLSIDRSEIKFDDLEVGFEKIETVQITNMGDVPITVSKINVDSRDGALDLAENTCVSPLYNGKSCKISITFQPTKDFQSIGKILLPWQSQDGQSGTEAISLSAKGFIRIPPEDPLKKAIAQAETERDESGAISRDLRSPVQTPPAATEFKNSERDPTITAPEHKDIGLPLQPWTFPRDRSRIITTTRYIRCVLETAIDSSLPGSVLCTVESHVYGGDGRKVLIPAGTRVEGDYVPLAKTGDTRLNVEWKRFERPDGSSFYTAKGFQAMDAIGRTGLPGEIDNRWQEKYSSALLVTGIAAAFAYATPQTNQRLQGAQQTASDNLSSIVKQQLEDSFDLRPITQISAGTRLIIKPLADMFFPNAEVIVAADATAAPVKSAPASPTTGGNATSNANRPRPSGQSATLRK